ncbi:MAG: NAD(P)-dependent oxidoreductase [Clostridiales Family XIII bacterium]|jgi:UDP-glucose 4-epimerase|nr:NAD(P)-dependent oxidoreductase [Clostridiales Family XIII bacterium]
MKAKKIGVVGANSYIARNLIHVLGRTPGRYALALYDTAETHRDGVGGYACVNLVSGGGMERIDFDCDLLFCFVGKTGGMNGFSEFELFLDANEAALLRLLEASRAADGRARIVFPSTRLVYRGRRGALSEDAEKAFKTVYAMNKWACENYLRMYHEVFGVGYSIFRICLPYGTLIEGAASYGTADFMLRAAREGKDITLYGDGSQRRTLTHIEDLCRLLIAGGLSPSCAANVFNIGGEDYSLAEMAALVARRFDVGVVHRPWPKDALAIESGDTVFDDAKLVRALGPAGYRSFENWIGAS